MPPAHPESAPLTDGDAPTWFEANLWPHVREVRAFLRVRYPASPDHDDILQDALMRTVLAHRREPIRNGKAFLFRAARNAALDRIRRIQRAPFVDVSAETAHSIQAEERTAAEWLNHKQELERMEVAIQELPPCCRQVLVLRRFHGLSTKEVAEQCGVSASTVEAQMTRAFQKIRLAMTGTESREGAREFMAVNQ